MPQEKISMKKNGQKIYLKQYWQKIAPIIYNSNLQIQKTQQNPNRMTTQKATQGPWEQVAEERR